MSKYKGIFTFDVENHRYLPVEQADGLIAEMDCHPEQDPLIKDEKIRKAVRAWAEATRTTSVDIQGNELESRQNDSWIIFDGEIIGLVADAGDNYTIAELCGEDEE